VPSRDWDHTRPELIRFSGVTALDFSPMSLFEMFSQSNTDTDKMQFYRNRHGVRPEREVEGEGWAQKGSCSCRRFPHDMAHEMALAHP